MDLCNIWCIKTKDNRVLLREGEIKEMRKNYFHKLYNRNTARGVGLDVYHPRTIILYCCGITESDANRKMRISRKELTIFRLKFGSVW